MRIPTIWKLVFLVCHLIVPQSEHTWRPSALSQRKGSHSWPFGILTHGRTREGSRVKQGGLKSFQVHRLALSHSKGRIHVLVGRGKGYILLSFGAPGCNPITQVGENGCLVVTQDSGCLWKLISLYLCSYCSHLGTLYIFMGLC